MKKENNKTWNTRELIFSARKKDFRIDWFSGTGGGGQHRNKHRNCCRITHIESGLSATGQEHRERPANQKAAFERLTHRLVAHYVAKHDFDQYRSDKRIRTYHEPRNSVLDHASGHQLTYKYVVLDGNLEEMINARRRAMMEEDNS